MSLMLQVYETLKDMVLQVSGACRCSVCMLCLRQIATAHAALPPLADFTSLLQPFLVASGPKHTALASVARLWSPICCVHAGVATERDLSVWTRLMAGAAAGTVGQTVAYPLDVVRRRMQVPSSCYNHLTLHWLQMLSLCDCGRSGCDTKLDNWAPVGCDRVRKRALTH